MTKPQFTYAVSRGFARGRFRWLSMECWGVYMIRLNSWPTRKAAQGCVKEWALWRGQEKVKR